MTDQSPKLPPETSKDTLSATSLQVSGDGLSPSSLQDGAQTDLFGQALAPANPSPPPAKAKAGRITVTSGQSGSTSSEVFGKSRGGGAIPTIFGEQVASAIPHGWLDGVFTDLEGEGYSCGAAVLPACSVNAPHKRDRLWFVANASNERLQIGGSGQMHEPRPEQESERLCPMAHPAIYDDRGDSRKIQSKDERCTAKRPQGGDGTLGHASGGMADSIDPRPQRGICGRSDTGREDQRGYTGRCSTDDPWADTDWIMCGDGKARRIPTTESGIRLLAHGFPQRVGLLRAGGNAIVSQVAAGFIKASDQVIRGLA